MTVADIKTDVGNRVLMELVRAGWVVEYEYPDSAIDKGIAEARSGRDIAWEDLDRRISKKYGLPPA